MADFFRLVIVLKGQLQRQGVVEIVSGRIVVQCGKILLARYGQFDLAAGCGFSLLVDVDKLIAPASQSDFFCVFQRVQAVPGFHAADE